MKDTVVIGWGRMNPVTNGHQLVVDTLKSVARKANADPFLYISHTTGNAKNPLTYEQKINGYPRPLAILQSNPPIGI